MIIRSVRHRGLKRLIEDNQTRGIRPDLVNRIRNVLTALILAEDMAGFRGSAPPGWRVHQLSGDRKDTWSVSTSGNWRITFEEEDGYLDLLDLEITTDEEERYQNRHEAVSSGRVYQDGSS